MVAFVDTNTKNMLNINLLVKKFVNKRLTYYKF